MDQTIEDKEPNEDITWGDCFELTKTCMKAAVLGAALHILCWSTARTEHNVADKLERELPRTPLRDLVGVMEILLVLLAIAAVEFIYRHSA